MKIVYDSIGQIRTNYLQTEQVPGQPDEFEEGHFLELKSEYKNACQGLEKFTYIYVLFYLNKINKEDIKMTLNKNGQSIGLFSCRTPNRPNPIGLSIVRLLRINQNRIYISGIDALDKTPILDVKPYIKGLDIKADANYGWTNGENNEGDTVFLYTDGACSGNPGPGGYAAVIVRGRHEEKIAGFNPKTTNNRMELQAVIEGLKEIKPGHKVKLVSDSNYVLKGLEEWMSSWKSREWKTAGNKPVKNMDLWRELDQLSSKYNLEYIKVKGHSGHEYNEMVDMLARKQIEINIGG